MTTTPDETSAEEAEPANEVAHAQQSPEGISVPDSARFVGGDLEDEEPTAQ